LRASLVDQPGQRRPTCDRRRDHSACRPRVAPACVAGKWSSACSSAVAREKRARDRRALVRAARLGRAEVVVGRCRARRGGSSRYGSLVVQNRTNVVARRPKLGRTEAVAGLCEAERVITLR
jgi:hypothetical protein